MEHFSRNDIRVDGDFARFGSKSYAINKINSVDVRVHQPVSSCLPVVLWIGAAVMTLAAVRQLSPGFLVTAGLLALGALVMQRESKRRIYRLFLTTSSSEAQAYESGDGEEVSALRQAIETAMAGRGLDSH